MRRALTPARIAIHNMQESIRIKCPAKIKHPAGIKHLTEKTPRCRHSDLAPEPAAAGYLLFLSALFMRIRS